MFWYGVAYQWRFPLDDNVGNVFINTINVVDIPLSKCHALINFSTIIDQLEHHYCWGSFIPGSLRPEQAIRLFLPK